MGSVLSPGEILREQGQSQHQFSSEFHLHLDVADPSVRRIHFGVDLLKKFRTTIHKIIECS